MRFASGGRAMPDRGRDGLRCDEEHDGSSCRDDAVDDEDDADPACVHGSSKAEGRLRVGSRPSSHAFYGVAGFTTSGNTLAVVPP